MERLIAYIEARDSRTTPALDVQCPHCGAEARNWCAVVPATLPPEAMSPAARGLVTMVGFIHRSREPGEPLPGKVTIYKAPQQVDTPPGGA